MAQGALHLPEPGNKQRGGGPRPGPGGHSIGVNKPCLYRRAWNKTTGRFTERRLEERSEGKLSSTTIAFARLIFFGAPRFLWESLRALGP